MLRKKPEHASSTATTNQQAIFAEALISYIEKSDDLKDKIQITLLENHCLNLEFQKRSDIYFRLLHFLLSRAIKDYNSAIEISYFDEHKSKSEEKISIHYFEYISIPWELLKFKTSQEITPDAVQARLETLRTSFFDPVERLQCHSQQCQSNYIHFHSFLAIWKYRNAKSILGLPFLDKLCETLQDKLVFAVAMGDHTSIESLLAQGADLKLPGNFKVPQPNTENTNDFQNCYCLEISIIMCDSTMIRFITENDGIPSIPHLSEKLSNWQNQSIYNQRLVPFTMATTHDMELSYNELFKQYYEQWPTRLSSIALQKCYELYNATPGEPLSPSVIFINVSRETYGTITYAYDIYHKVEPQTETSLKHKAKDNPRVLTVFFSAARRYRLADNMTTTLIAEHPSINTM